jgi:hypothetical protein
MMGSGSYLVNGRQESRFIRLGWLIIAADLTHELQGGCPNFGVIGGLLPWKPKSRLTSRHT